MFDKPQDILDYKRSSAILYPDDEWPTNDDGIQVHYEKFVKALEKCLNVQRSRTSLGKIWDSSKPPRIALDLHAYLDTVSKDHMSWRDNGPEGNLGQVVGDVKLPQQERFFCAFEEEYKTAFRQQLYFNPVIRAIRYDAQDPSAQARVLNSKPNIDDF